MWILVGFAILFVLLVPLVVAIRRSTELCVVSVDSGKVRFVRGRMPQRLLHDVADVVVRERIQDARIRIVSEGGSPRVVGENLSEGALQRLRNVVGSYQVAQIRAGGRPR